MVMRRLISTQRESWVKASSVEEQVREILPLWRDSTARAAYLQNWHDAEVGVKDLPSVPRQATDELKQLTVSSSTPWAKMITDSMSQHLIFDDIRMKEGGQAPAYRLVERNSLGSRQRPVHDGGLIHGKSFNLIMPGRGRRDGEPTAIIRGKSALSCDAFFRDDFDEYPEFFLEGWTVKNDDGTEELRLNFYDEAYEHQLVVTSGDKVELIESNLHGFDLCPVVRFAPNLALTGRTMGEVEPYLGLFRRIGQSTYDRLVVQRYGAFVVRWIAGIETPKTDEERRAKAMALSVTDLLVSPDKETKFGSLPGTPLDGYIRSREADIRDLSAVSQTPSFHMLGLSDNVGAEGLAAAESAQIRKRNLIRRAYGESWEASFRLGGEAMGSADIADDFTSRLHWELTETYAFQSLAQGLTTLAEGLGIPGQMLWHRIPDWNQEDTIEALKLVQQLQDEQELQAEIEQQRQVEMAQATEEAKARANSGAAPR